MRLLHLPTFWTVLLDFALWFIIHMGVVLLMVRIPTERFDPACWLYREKRWEKEGRLYQGVFRIKTWKRHLPDGAPLLGNAGFPKKNHQGRDEAYLREFMLETCRTELTHWIILLFAPLFFLWNTTWVGFLMIFYAAAENLPLIVAQRYNRIRFRRILRNGNGAF